MAIAPIRPGAFDVAASGMQAASGRLDADASTLASSGPDVAPMVVRADVVGVDAAYAVGVWFAAATAGAAGRLAATVEALRPT